jgi:hypothetical protein
MKEKVAFFSKCTILTFYISNNIIILPTCSYEGSNREAYLKASSVIPVRLYPPSFFICRSFFCSNSDITAVTATQEAWHLHHMILNT